jgi:uncharacterized protein YkwD
MIRSAGLRGLVLLALLALIAACGSEPQTLPYQPRETSVNPASAAAKINAYRASRGLAPLTVDPVLNRMAAETAREIAGNPARQRELHSNAGVQRRFEAAGYPILGAAENIGKGYPTLDTAIAGWQGSRGHDRNLLHEDMTRVGIGLALTGADSFKSYWVLLLALPDDGTISL